MLCVGVDPHRKRSPASSRSIRWTRSAWYLERAISRRACESSELGIDWFSDKHLEVV